MKPEKFVSFERGEANKSVKGMFILKCNIHTNTLQVFVNGIFQSPGIDYNMSGLRAIQFAKEAIPTKKDIVAFSYWKI